jgi:hypothetical protein
MMVEPVGSHYECLWITADSKYKRVCYLLERI